MHCNWTFILIELFLVSLWTFSKGTQQIKHEAVLNAFRKRGRKYEPEGTKQ